MPLKFDIVLYFLCTSLVNLLSFFYLLLFTCVIKYVHILILLLSKILY